MQDKCKNCLKPSKECIPFLMTLTTKEMLEWCRFWKEKLGWSNSRLAENSGVPKGTIDRHMSHAKSESGAGGITLENIRPIICALTGCTMEELKACRDAHSNNFASLLEKNRYLEDDNARLKREAVNQRTFLAEQIAGKDKQIHLKDRYIGILAIAFGITLFCLAAYVLGDLSDPAWGYLYRH